MPLSTSPRLKSRNWKGPYLPNPVSRHVQAFGADTILHQPGTTRFFCPDAEEARHRRRLARETGDPKRLRQRQPRTAERRDDAPRYGDKRPGGPLAQGARERGGGNRECALT